MNRPNLLNRMYGSERTMHVAVQFGFRVELDRKCKIFYNISIFYKQVCLCKNIWNLGLPCWLSGKESTCQCKRQGFGPCSRKIPHAAEQLSPCTTTTDPAPCGPGAVTTESTCHKYWSVSAQALLCNKRNHHKEDSCATTREKPLSLQLKKGPCSNEDPAQPKINRLKKQEYMESRKMVQMNLSAGQE